MADLIRRTFRRLRMLDNFYKMLDYVPFLCIVNGKVNINTARIVEALIIAVVGGAFAAYITVAKLEVRIQNMEKKLERMERDFYIPKFGR